MGRLARRFLLSVSIGYGHLHPLMPLAQALAQRGHEVAFAVGPSLQPLVEAAGFAVFPLTENLAVDPAFGPVRAQVRMMPPGLERELFNWTQIAYGVAPRVRTPELVAIAQTWRPDMLIREAGECTAVIAAEHLGMPHAAVAFTAALKGMAVFERDAAAHLDPIRQQWGLSPDPALTALYRYLHLAFSPPSFGLQAVGQEVNGADTASALPATTHFIRPAFFDQADHERLPGWVAELPAMQPTIYVTLGTEVNRRPEFYPSVLQAILAGLRDLPVNLIVTLGRDKDPADFGPQPANVHIERYLPHSLLLRQCNLLVMHGGSNSLLAALDVGLPMVVVPLMGDEFFNAQVVHGMRLGQVVPREQLTPASIRAAVDNVLNQAIYRHNVGRLQAELHALPDQTSAAALVERVAADHRPVLRSEWGAPRQSPT